MLDVLLDSPARDIKIVFLFIGLILGLVIALVLDVFEKRESRLPFICTEDAPKQPEQRPSGWPNTHRVNGKFAKRDSA